jgi:molybdate transport system regulatory protein
MRDIRYIVKLYHSGQTLAIEATITLRNKEIVGIGRERIRLLQVVAQAGSIAAGAKAVGLSYKAAWDALDAMTKLFGQPLLEKRTGGRSGGSACLTPTGFRVIELFGRLEAEMARAFRAFAPVFAGTAEQPSQLPDVQTANAAEHNSLRGKISAIASDALGAEIAVAVSDEITVISRASTDCLCASDFRVGGEANLSIDASSVVIAPGLEPPLLSARNCVRGVVRQCDIFPVTARIVLDIGDNRTLVACLTAHRAADLKLSPGDPACALFDDSHVIIAID